MRDKKGQIYDLAVCLDGARNGIRKDPEYSPGQLPVESAYQTG
jgi:hypothetical protein